MWDFTFAWIPDFQNFHRTKTEVGEKGLGWPNLHLTKVWPPPVLALLHNWHFSDPVHKQTLQIFFGGIFGCNHILFWCENSPHFCIKKLFFWHLPCVYHAQKLLPNNKSYRGTFPVLCWEPIAGPSVWDPLSAEATPSSHKIIRSRNKSCLEVKGRFYILEHTHILRGQMYSTQFCLIHQGILIWLEHAQ